MAERINRDELRALIREALKEALGTTPVPPPSSMGERDHAKHGGGGGSKRSVGHSPLPPPSAVPLPRSAGEDGAARSAEYRLLSGVLNESKVAELGRTHSKIIIGADVAVTPLARDRAREIQVEIVRQKP